jgi:structural maintenance of chromosome 1
VDAALDPTNVSKLARYIGTASSKGVQFLIISLKSALYVISDGRCRKMKSQGLTLRYEHADGLVGVYREQEENSSRTLSLDLRKVSDMYCV